MEIKTDDLFDSEFDKCVDYALLEFGRKTARKWIDSLIGIKHQLRLMPERYPFVPELQKWRKYRGAIIMENFKIIYFLFSVGILKKYLVKSGEEWVKSFREHFTSDNCPVYRYSGGVGEE